MKSIINKLLVGFAGLALASVPLAASAQNADGHGHGGGAYHGSTSRGQADNRGGGGSRGESYSGGRSYSRGNSYSRGGTTYRVEYAQPIYEQPVYQQPYDNGYFGLAPGGFSGYYWNGGWYHHRRWNGGVWLYF